MASARPRTGRRQSALTRDLNAGLNFADYPFRVELAIERAKRLVEAGQHVFILLDSITRRLVMRVTSAREEPTTLEDLSQQYGISRERVRQVEVRAFEKLQKAIKAAAIERRLVTH